MAFHLICVDVSCHLYCLRCHAFCTADSTQLLIYTSLFRVVTPENMWGNCGEVSVCTDVLDISPVTACKSFNLVILMWKQLPIHSMWQTSVCSCLLKVYVYVYLSIFYGCVCDCALYWCVCVCIWYGCVCDCSVCLCGKLQHWTQSIHDAVWRRRWDKMWKVKMGLPFHFILMHSIWYCTSSYYPMTFHSTLYHSILWHSIL